MSDTPFTDSCTYGFTDEDGIHCEAVHADIARTLERELDRYKSDVEIAAKEIEQLERERDEARRSSDAAHKRIHDLSIENDNLKFELAQAVQARAMWQMKYNTTVAKMDLSEGGNKA